MFRYSDLLGGGLFALLLLCSGFSSTTGCSTGVKTTEKTETKGEGGSSKEGLAGDAGTEKRPNEASPKEASNPEPQPKEVRPEKPADAGPQEQPTPKDTGTGKIEIYLKGDVKAETFTDGLSGQTPTDYVIAISRYYVLQSASDPAPQLCFDHGTKYVEADMSKDNLVGSCHTQTIKDGDYTHGKVKVEWVRYTVNGILHYGQQPLQGKFTFFRAYSDTTYDNKSYKAKEGWLEFKGPTTIRVPYTYPANPPLPGGQFIETGGEFFMVFPYKKALPIAQQNKETHWARFHWKIFEAFRWAEKLSPSFAKGVWDVMIDPSSSEEVKVNGVNGYFITTSID